MNIVIIHDSGIDTFKTWRQALDFTSVDKKDFTQVGADYVLTLTGDSYEVSKDIKLLERAAAKHMFKKNRLEFSDLLLGFVAIMTFVMLVK